MRVQEASINLLTGSGLTEHQHRRIVLGDLEHLGAQALHHLAAADRLGHDPLLAAQILVFRANRSASSARSTVSSSLAIDSGFSMKS